MFRSEDLNVPVLRIRKPSEFNIYSILTYGLMPSISYEVFGYAAVLLQKYLPKFPFSPDIMGSFGAYFPPATIRKMYGRDNTNLESWEVEGACSGLALGIMLADTLAPNDRFSKWSILLRVSGGLLGSFFGHLVVSGEAPSKAGVERKPISVTEQLDKKAEVLLNPIYIRFLWILSKVFHPVGVLGFLAVASIWPKKFITEPLVGVADHFTQPVVEGLKINLEKINTGLSDEINKNPTLYGPVIGSFLTFPLSLGADLLKMCIASRVENGNINRRNLQNDYELQIKEANNYFNETKEFYKAAVGYRKGREYFLELHQDNMERSQLVTLLVRHLMNEATALFRCERYSDPENQYALEILDEVIKLSAQERDAYNLRGYIHLALAFKEGGFRFTTEVSEEKINKELVNAKKSFLKSLKIDRSQSDIFMLHAYCNEHFDVVASFSELNYQNLFASGAAHTVLYCRAESLGQIFLKNIIKSEKNHLPANTVIALIDKKFDADYDKLLASKDQLFHIIESYEGALQALPQNPCYSMQQAYLLDRCASLYLLTASVIQCDEYVSISILIPRHFSEFACALKSSHFNDSQVRPTEFSAHKGREALNQESILKRAKDYFMRSKNILAQLKYARTEFSLYPMADDDPIAVIGRGIDDQLNRLSAMQEQLLTARENVPSVTSP